MPNNREFATLILFGLLLLWVLSRRDLRASFGSALKAAFAPRLAVIWVVYAAALLLTVWALRYLGLRYEGANKDAVVWALVVGLPVLVKFDSAAKQPGSFGSLLRRAVGLTAIVEFYVNLYVFPLWVELLLQPFAALLAMLTVVAETRQEWTPVKRLTEGCLAVLGFVVAGVVAVHLVTNLRELDGTKIALSFLQPVLLTAVVVALTYLLAVYSSYELAFMRMKFPIVPTTTSRWSKVALVVGLHFRVHKVSGFAGHLPRRLKSRPGYRDASNLVSDYKHGRTTANDPPEV